MRLPNAPPGPLHHPVPGLRGTASLNANRHAVCYFTALLCGIPLSRPDPRERSQRIVLEGDVPDPANPPGGCYFHPRCQSAVDICQTETPELKILAGGHRVACHLAEDLDPRGIGEIVPRSTPDQF